MSTKDDFTPDEYPKEAPRVPRSGYEKEISDLKAKNKEILADLEMLRNALYNEIIIRHPMPDYSTVTKRKFNIAMEPVRLFDFLIAKYKV
jgi:hypothetical protein